MISLALATLLTLSSVNIEIFKYPDQTAEVQQAVVVDLNVQMGNGTIWKFRKIGDKSVAILWGTADMPCKEPKPGCISVQKFVFKALRSGKTQAMFELVKGPRVYQRVYVDIVVQ